MFLVRVLISRTVTSEVVRHVMGSSRICSTEDSLRFFFDRDDAPRLAVGVLWRADILRLFGMGSVSYKLQHMLMCDIDYINKVKCTFWYKITLHFIILTSWFSELPFPSAMVYLLCNMDAKL